MGEILFALDPAELGTGQEQREFPFALADEFVVLHISLLKTLHQFLYGFFPFSNQEFYGRNRYEFEQGYAEFAVKSSLKDRRVRFYWRKFNTAPA